MNTSQLIPPDKVGPQIAATAGLLLSLLMHGKLGWREALLIVMAGSVFAYIFTNPVASWMGASQQWFAPIGFLFGFAGLYLIGALSTVLTEFQVAPFALIKRLLKAIKGEDPTS